MKRLFNTQHFFRIYSGILTIVFAVTIFGGFAPARKTSFEEIDVQRINVVEPDGTLRMVISDKTRFPGIVIKRQERPHPNRSSAGMLFFNDEGTENGGLIFGGSKDKDGKPTSYGHLSFDEYEQDQVFTIDASQEGDQRRSGLAVNDDPNYPIMDLLAAMDRVKNLARNQQQAELDKFFEAHGRPHQRVYLGRSPDHSVALRLKDVEGRDRMVLQVAADGSPVIRFLDQDGKVVSQIPTAIQ